MFAAHHQLGNLTLILDKNNVAMLGWCKRTLDIEPHAGKFTAFGWDAISIPDGNDVKEVYHSLLMCKTRAGDKPLAIIANTVKGKGVASLESNPLSHVMSLTAKEIDDVLAGDDH